MRVQSRSRSEAPSRNSPSSATACSSGRELLDSDQGRGRRRSRPRPSARCSARTRPSLYRYDADRAKQTVATPVLVVYGLVGRYTMADLQEDRSLVRNLLAQGVDLYVVDWGNPTRSDRWLTLEDYIDGYLDECVDFICREHGRRPGQRCSASAKAASSPSATRRCNPSSVKNLIAHHHADRLPRRPGRRTRRCTTASSTCGRAA